MIKTLQIQLLLLLSLSLQAQTFKKAISIPGIDFFNTVGISTLPDGKIIVGGNRMSNFNGIISLLDKDGQMIWSREFVGVEVRDCSGTIDGDIIVAVRSLVEFEKSGLIKLSSNGEVLWYRKFDNALLSNVLALSDGYIVVGDELFMMKVSTSGQLMWQSSQDLPGQLLDVQQTSDGFLYACGHSAQYGVLSKYSAGGALLWTKLIEPTSGLTADFTAIVTAPVDRVFLFGTTGDSGGAGMGGLVMGFDTQGSMLWSKGISGLGLVEDAVLGAGNTLLSVSNFANQSSRSLIFAMNTSGDLLWSKNYEIPGLGHELHNITVTPDQYILATGITEHSTGDDGYFLKADATGNIADCCQPDNNLNVTYLPAVVKPVVPNLLPNISLQIGFVTVDTADLVTYSLCEPIPTGFEVSSDTICPGECISIVQMDSLPGIIYSFETPGADAGFCYPIAGIYTIVRKGDLNGCEKQSAKQILVSGVDIKAIPTAFTPDGDGVNDVFRLSFVCPPAKFEMQVFDRWGNKAFTTRDPLMAWDGKLNGEDAASDLYFWRAVADGMPYKGEIVLIR
ncbi:MAG: gliding motility-associated C-terminal domain-containing protein [Lewinellaceae bacterium]|nr:gliding motility-associated C-terminal domain-containing protein [Lewinellaceae bacterium]